jgi:hypothetical protein
MTGKLYFEGWVWEYYACVMTAFSVYDKNCGKNFSE